MWGKHLLYFVCRFVESVNTIHFLTFSSFHLNFTGLIASSSLHLNLLATPKILLIMKFYRIKLHIGGGEADANKNSNEKKKYSKRKSQKVNSFYQLKEMTNKVSKHLPHNSIIYRWLSKDKLNLKCFKYADSKGGF